MEAEGWDENVSEATAGLFGESRGNMISSNAFLDI